MNCNEGWILSYLDFGQGGLLQNKKSRITKSVSHCNVSSGRYRRKYL